MYNNRIDFLTRLLAGCKLYVDLVNQHGLSLDRAANAVRYNHRTLFIKVVTTKLYGALGSAYLVLDLARKSKEVDKILAARHMVITEEELHHEFNHAGIMVLISS